MRATPSAPEPEPDTELLVPKHLYKPILALMGAAGMIVIGSRVYSATGKGPDAAPGKGPDAAPGKGPEIKELQERAAQLKSSLGRLNADLKQKKARLSELQTGVVKATQVEQSAKDQVDKATVSLNAAHATTAEKEAEAADATKEVEDAAASVAETSEAEADAAQQLTQAIEEVQEAIDKYKQELQALETQLPQQKKSSFTWF